jgi:hypothetical protein
MTAATGNAPTRFAFEILQGRNVSNALSNEWNES